MYLLEVALGFEMDGRFRARRAVAFRGTCWFHAAEFPLHQFQHLFVSDVARGSHHQMIRREPFPETRKQRIAIEGLDSLRSAENRTPERMLRPEAARKNFVKEIFGIVRSILISSRTTWRSLFTSSESNFGRRTRSAMMSKAMGKCSSRILALKQICSLEVKASSMPPTESISRAIASAERRSVPLKTMCSMKWARPFSSGTSRREPLRTQTPTESERT